MFSKYCIPSVIAGLIVIAVLNQVQQTRNLLIIKYILRRFRVKRGMTVGREMTYSYMFHVNKQFMKNLAGIIFLTFVFFPFTLQAQRFTNFGFLRAATGLNYIFPVDIDHDNRTITVKSERDRQGWIENIDRLAASFTLDGIRKTHYVHGCETDYFMLRACLRAKY